MSIAERARAVVVIALALAGCRASRRPPPASPPSKDAPLDEPTGGPSRMGEAWVGTPASADRPTPLARVTVPRALTAPRRDGDPREPAWGNAARVVGFLDPNGMPARPHSEARFVWHERSLYALLYAADEDIRAPVDAHDAGGTRLDFFRLRVRPRDVAAGDTFYLKVGPDASVEDRREGPGGARDAWFESGAKAAVDLDGTLNKADDDDEEWVVELELPLAPLGVEAREGATFALGVSRCDTPKDGPPRCGAWEGSLTLGSSAP